MSWRIAAGETHSRQAFRAGAPAIDVSPRTFPVLVNGGFLQNSATKLNDPIFAKCLVLDDGTTRLAIVVVDSCMMPRELIDRAKAIAREKTGIPTERMLISATHTHSAPAAMGALGMPARCRLCRDSAGPDRRGDRARRPQPRAGPRRLGGRSTITEHTFCRRWIRRPDRMLDDPFGKRTVRANMHPGYQNPDAIAPSGPVDPALTVLSVQSRSGPADRRAGQLLDALLRRDTGLGRLLRPVRRRPGPADRRREQAEHRPFVAIMSQGTSGDQMWMDYGRPKKDPGLDAYADAVAASADQAYRAIAYHDYVPLAMAETTLDPRPPRARRGPAGLGPRRSSPRWSDRDLRAPCPRSMPGRRSTCTTSPAAS